MLNQKRIALVTGANKGIGLETARQLAQAGFTVLLGSRDSQKGQTAAQSLQQEGLDVQPIVIDVDNPASIAEAAHHVQNQHGHLDALVNNAAVNLDPLGGNDPAVPTALYRQTFETNLFGLIETTNAFLPLLLKSPAARIVNLSSVLASNTLHANPKSDIYNFKYPAYDVSKTAVNAFTVHLAYALKDTKIKVNAAHPGWVKTEMGGEQAPMEIPDGAKTSVHLATLPEDGPSGGFFHLGKPLPW